ncbi:orotidine 5'-phosphate decarboxylase / HUMPS family protein [Nocardia sp. NPDC050193]
MNDAAVSNWERRGAEAKLRYETQQILDTELARSEPNVVTRFELILRSGNRGDSPDNEAGSGRSSLVEQQLGAGSRPRTTVLLATANAALIDGPYRVDQGAVSRFRKFLESTARVFVLAGGLGSGKTCLSRYLVRDCEDRVDFQLHMCSTWTLSTTDLATEILRYGSLPSGNDALLTLERAADALADPLMVVIDDIGSQEQLSFVGRQVDALLRQTSSHNLRFVLVVRTPPELDLSPFPILAASTFGRVNSSQMASYTLMPWSMAETREWWDRTRSENEIPFAHLPQSLQSLATIPLYTQLLHGAGEVAQDVTKHRVANGFHLVAHCVRTVLGQQAQPVDPAIEYLARIACELAPDDIPNMLVDASRIANDSKEFELSVSPFLERTPGGSLRFTHDIFSAYFLAIRIADQMADLGRSSTTVAAFNELADRASQSASARSVFDFVVCALDARAHHLIEVIASAPAVTVDIALPMLLETMASTGVLIDEVVLSAARRCSRTQAQALTIAVLAMPTLPEVLGNRHAQWLVEQLRTHGSDIWRHIARHVEDVLDIEVSARIARHIDLDSAPEAAFLARYFDLFTSSVHNPDEVLPHLMHHIDWRVRAALAESLPGRSRPFAPAQVGNVVEQLAADHDYKVRASLARVISTLDTPHTHPVFRRLLADGNWHVREQALQGIVAATQHAVRDPLFADDVLSTIATDKSWLRPPTHIAKLVTRVQLLNGGSTPDSLPTGDIGLLGLLKEVRSGWITLPPELKESLVSYGERSAHWLTAREASAVRQRHKPSTSSIQEWYRRHRGKRSLQIALDVHALDRAVEIAQVAMEAGVDFIEVGDPLIKREGTAAIETIKRFTPDTAVVAEMMSSDWGRDQVELAAVAGADVVLLIGPASIASVSTAVAAAQRLEVALTLDVAPRHVSPAWIRDMERTGIDGFVVTTNIDLGIRGDHHPLDTAAEIRRYSQLPVAVSGGFDPDDDALSRNDWDIAIIGRSVADSVTPADTVAQLARLKRKFRTKENL